MATSLVAELAEKLSSATNSLDFDEQTLFINTSTNKVAIGTNAPVTDLTIEGPITIKEQADADADTAAYGQIWVNTATPNQLYFTTDAGDDVQITDGTALAGAFDTDAAQVFNESGADVDFRVESDNNVNMIFVDGGNDRVGIGTSAPGALLDVRGPVGTGATGAGVLRLSTAELTVVDADQLGRIEFIAPVDTAGDDAITVGASIWAEADATFSASVNETDLVFATGASGAATEKMRIASDGDVTLTGDLTAPSFSGSGASLTALSGTNISTGTVAAARVATLNQNTTGYAESLNDTATFAVSASKWTSSVNISAPDFEATSDRKIKKNFKPVEDALGLIDKVKIHRYEYKENDLPGVGVIAQELQEIMPEAVSEGETLTVRYNYLFSVLVQAVQELNEKVKNGSSIVS